MALSYASSSSTSSSDSSGRSAASSSPMSSGNDEPTNNPSLPGQNHQRKNHNQNNHHHHSSPTSTTLDHHEMDTRKVEPLKINLQYREPIKTIIKLNKSGNNGTTTNSSSSSIAPDKHPTATTTPKITIKPLVNPNQQTDSVADTATTNNHSISSVQSTTTNTLVEPHIVPKLTIRTASSQSEIVPKLTIAYNHSASAVSTTSAATNFHHEDGIKLTIKPIVEPPIPKMTIKANEIVTITALPSTTTTTTSTKPSTAEVTTSPSVPKIKIKQIGKTTDEPGEGGATTFTISRSDDDEPPQTVPKLLVRVPQPETNSEVIPRLTIRPIIKPNHDESANIVIPKVTIKPIVNNDQVSTETLVTPKITIKPIPKPVAVADPTLQPLEIVVTSGEFVSSIPDLCQSSVDGQQSPRIILKINKASKESPVVVPTNQQQPQESIDQNAQISSSSSTSNELKRTHPTEPLSTSEPDGKKIRSNPEPTVEPAVIPPAPAVPPPAEESKLKEILSRMHNRSTNNAVEDVLVTPPTRKMQTNSSVRRAIRPPPSSQSDNAITLPPEMEFAASLFREEPVSKPVRLHPLLLQNIERAKLLEAMMNSEPRTTTPTKVISSDKPHIGNSLCSEGSSSDCVIVETTATNGLGGHLTSPSLHPFSVVGRSNGPGVGLPSDQDSGVDVAGGGGLVAGVADNTTPVKRKRGRPKKEPGALSAK